MSQSQKVFLSAEWRDLVMLNYEVEAGLLHRFVPHGTSLDSFMGRTYLSLVGFQFCHTKLFGRLPVLFHTDFDEVNLRFYVRRKHGSENRRGVVFIAEVVPRRAIATTARLLYGENYVRLPMRHRIETSGSAQKLEYQWRVGQQWCGVSAQTEGPPILPLEGSLEQFITEHYWGYSSQRSGGCIEYRVEHTPWRMWTASQAAFAGDAAALYGRELAAILQRKPHSAFVAAGSPVVVFSGSRVQ